MSWGYLLNGFRITFLFDGATQESKSLLNERIFGMTYILGHMHFCEILILSLGLKQWSSTGPLVAKFYK